MSIVDKLMGQALGKAEADVAQRRAPVDKDLRAQNKAIKEQQARIRRSQRQRAEDYTRGVEQESKRQIENQREAIRRGAASRGLLYSGLRQAAESQAALPMAQQMQAQREAINRRLGDEAFQAELQTVANLQQELGLTDRRNAMLDARRQAEEQRRQQATGGLIGGLGNVVGTALGFGLR